MNKLKTEIKFSLVIILTLAIGLIYGSIVIELASAVYWDDFSIECGQPHYELMDEDGYIFYEADAVWEDDTLVSMEAKYNNGALQINSKKGWSDPKFMMYSPLTCEQFKSKSFTEFSPELIKVDPIIKENKELKVENDNLQTIVKSLQEQVSAIMKVLENIT